MLVRTLQTGNQRKHVDMLWPFFNFTSSHLILIIPRQKQKIQEIEVKREERTIPALELVFHHDRIQLAFSVLQYARFG
jgi:hypothetical protein